MDHFSSEILQPVVERPQSSQLRVANDSAFTGSRQISCGASDIGKMLAQSSASNSAEATRCHRSLAITSKSRSYRIQDVRASRNISGSFALPQIARPDKVCVTWKLIPPLSPRPTPHHYRHAQYTDWPAQQPVVKPFTLLRQLWHSRNPRI